jgi:hypothetical protein
MTTTCRVVSRLVAIAVASLSWACGSEDEGTDLGGMPGTPGTVTLLGELRPDAFCQMPEVERITIRATQIGCEPGLPAPCTLPAEPVPRDGDIATCPVTDPVRLLGVDVTEAGRYRVEAVGRFTTGEDVTRCFATPDGETEIVVTDADLDAGDTIDLVATDAACPAG